MSLYTRQRLTERRPPAPVNVYPRISLRQSMRYKIARNASPCRVKPGIRVTPKMYPNSSLFLMMVPFIVSCQTQLQDVYYTPFLSSRVKEYGNHGVPNGSERKWWTCQDNKT